MGFHSSSAGKESTCNAGDLGVIPGLGRFPGEGNNYPLQYSCLENSMDRRTGRATVHKSQRVRHNWVTLSLFHFHIYIYEIYSCIYVILLWTLICKESTGNSGNPSSIPRSGRSTGEGLGYPVQYSWAFLLAQLVKNPTAVWETWFNL